MFYNYKTPLTRLLRFAGMLQARFPVKIVSYESSQEGPKGETLFTYAIHIGPEDAENVQIVVIGTHGIEAYAALLAMIYVLKRLVLPHGVKLVIVVPLCPSGYAHGERTDKYNVNIGRACADYDFDNDEFENYVHVAGLDRFDEAAYWQIAQDPKELKALRRALTIGQRDYPNGFEYAGSGTCEARDILLTIVADLNKHHIRRATVLDVHTGIPNRGWATRALISFTSNPKVRETIVAIHGGDVSFPNLGEEGSTEDIKGSVLQFFEDQLGAREVVAPVIVEMGVGDPIAQGLAVVLRKHGLRFGNRILTTDEIAGIEKAFDYKFRVPGDRRWHERFRTCLDETLQQQLEFLVAT